MTRRGRERWFVGVACGALLVGCTTSPPDGTATRGAAATTDATTDPTRTGTSPAPITTPPTTRATSTGPAAEASSPEVSVLDEHAGAATPVPPTADPEPVFRSSVTTIDDALADRMHASWRTGCPVPLEDLRYVQVSHVDFEGAVHQGELVVHAEVAEGIVVVFARLFEIGYPIRSMRLVDDFGADDTASMDADNTSAFNCRAITGGRAWSEHAYGRALDLNPVENPYVVGSHVAPRAGRAFVQRAAAPGVIRPDDEVVRAFAAAGWRWGGYWRSPVDYQHFSTTGR